MYFGSRGRRTMLAGPMATADTDRKRADHTMITYIQALVFPVGQLVWQADDIGGWR